MRRDLICCGMAVLGCLLFLTGCKPAGSASAPSGGPANVATVATGQVPGPPPRPAANPTAPPAANPQSPAAKSPQAQFAGPPVEFATHEHLKFDPEISFDDLAARFAQARVDKKTLPTGRKELTSLYMMVMQTQFRGRKTPEELIKFFEEWAAAKPDDPSPHVILSKHYMQSAWEARGNGFAHTVTQENSRLFEERLDKALDHARAAEKMKPDDPELYSSLIGIGKGLGSPRGDVDEWVETSRKIDPTSFQTYQAATEYLLPRWHGGTGDIEHMAEDLATKIGGDDGLEAYARIAMITHMYDSHLILHGEFDFAKITAGAQVMQKRYPTAHSLVDFAAIIAWMDLRHADAKALLPYVLKKQPEMRLWGSMHFFNLYEEFCKQQPGRDRPDFIFHPFKYAVRDLEFIDGGKTLIALPAQKEFSIYLWRMDRLPRPITQLPRFPDWMDSVVTDSEGKLTLLEASTEKGHVVIVLALDRSREPVVVRDATQLAGSTLSPDGRTGASPREKQVVLWDVKTGDILHEMPFDEKQFPKLTFSPDSQKLIVTTMLKHHIFQVDDGASLLEANIDPKPGPGKISPPRTLAFLDPETAIGVGFEHVSGRFPEVLSKWTLTGNEASLFFRPPPSDAVSQKHTLHDVSDQYLLLEAEEYTNRFHSTFYIHRRSDMSVVRKFLLNTNQNHSLRARITPDEKRVLTYSNGQPGVYFWNIAPAGNQVSRSFELSR